MKNKSRIENESLICWFIGLIFGIVIGWLVVSAQSYFHELERQIEMEDVSGACNRPIDESQIRIAPTKETRGELAEMLDRQTRDISRAVDEKTQAIQKMMWSTR